ncbi:MAG: hypothetical protein AAGP08_11870 [Pseudomonadota bacterium]
MAKKPLAVMTMVRGDYHWARKWRAHYERQVQEPTDLYVIVHGQDPELAKIFQGCSVMYAPLMDAGLENFERRRLDFEHFFIRGLQAYFRCVLMVDVDEFVTLAPPRDGPLWRYLESANEGEMVRSALGFEVLHRADDPPLDLAQPVLAQRREVYCNAQYCKPCAFYFNFGGATHHRVWGAPWVIDADLLLFHLRYADRALLDTYVTSRKRYFAEQEEAGAGTSGSWKRPWKDYREILRQVEERPTGDLTEDRRAALREEILMNFARTNKIGKISSGRLTLPEHFASLL